jgi:hypothetical protein
MPAHSSAPTARWRARPGQARFPAGRSPSTTGSGADVPDGRGGDAMPKDADGVGNDTPGGGQFCDHRGRDGRDDPRRLRPGPGRSDRDRRPGGRVRRWRGRHPRDRGRRPVRAVAGPDYGRGRALAAAGDRRCRRRGADAGALFAGGRIASGVDDLRLRTAGTDTLRGGNGDRRRARRRRRPARRPCGGRRLRHRRAAHARQLQADLAGDRALRGHRRPRRSDRRARGGWGLRRRCRGQHPDRLWCAEQDEGRRRRLRPVRAVRRRAGRNGNRLRPLHGETASQSRTSCPGSPGSGSRRAGSTPTRASAC